MGLDVGNVLSGIPSSVAGAIAAAGGTVVLNQLSNLMRINHPMTMNFAVQIDGFMDAGFISCEGLHDRATPYEISQCNLPAPVKIYPYKREVGLINLKKGVTFQGKMEQWYYDTVRFEKGDPSPLRDVSIIQLLRLPRNVPILGGQLIEIVRYEIPECVCRDLTFPKYRASSENEISILESVIECTQPHLMPPPTSFGELGILIDALVK